MNCIIDYTNVFYILGCRKPKAAEDLLKTYRDEGITTGSIESFELDTSLISSVEKFAAKVKDKCHKIDVLLNLGKEIPIKYIT